MVTLIELDDNRAGYVQLFQWVLADGHEKPSRNGDTVELHNAIIEVAHPERTLPVGMNAKFKRDLWLLEAAQLLAGVSEPELMVKIAPNTKAFMEDDGFFWGSYGRRVEMQGGGFPAIVDRLSRNPNDRQALVTMWDGALDLPGGKRDHPCTMHMHFTVRGDQLLTTTVMRSNDVWWGWKYDCPVFCTVHLTMAKVLGLEPGPYTHVAHSLHVYTKDTDALFDMTYPAGEQDPYTRDYDLQSVEVIKPWCRDTMAGQNEWRAVEEEAFGVIDMLKGRYA